MTPDNLKNGDNDELEALFDSIAEQRSWDSGASATPAQQQAAAPDNMANDNPFADMDEGDGDDPHDVFRRVGSLTRKLHDALRELGYDKSVETAVNSLPDARARLNYIANLTGQAAEKVLATVEVSQKLNDDLADQANALDKAWDKLYNNEMSLEEFKAHAQANRDFVKRVSGHTGEMGSKLTDIMMAQDFHDLTGQVVNRIANMAQGLEEQLVQLLLDTTPPDQRKQVEETWLNGPAINTEGRTDVCANQGQVDDLLESLGF
ncbi:protein phosphatase CheZ [Limnobacter humi]|uniref:Protein phosphatase CheZ n=1 Tax=Limnobacter humi TaxID=1778671 RepID=A0ABT1WK04_9BURK|nr:protein phosphatase CheZ [Limnobacter humi]MCQ8897381.1 protein phosphatase CheZ [Limnobacter humi]